MNLICNLSDYNYNNVFFMEKRNNMLLSGNFTKLLYSDENVTLNSIYVDVNMRYNYTKIHNKTIIQINVNENIEIINNLSSVEQQLLNYYTQLNNINKRSVYSLKDNLLSGNIRIYKQNNYNNARLFLKISGIWETDNEIGITYKFIDGSII